MSTVASRITSVLIVMDGRAYSAAGAQLYKERTFLAFYEFLRQTGMKGQDSHRQRDKRESQSSGRRTGLMIDLSPATRALFLMSFGVSVGLVWWIHRLRAAADLRGLAPIFFVLFTGY